MKTFIFKLVIIIVVLLAVDRLAGYGLRKLYFSQGGEDYYFTTKAIDEQTSDLLILGSSRARNHYDATLISDSVGMSAFNCGRSGHFMVYQSAQLDLILDRYTPRVILLDVTPYDLAGRGDASEYDILSSLLPYEHHKSYKSLLRKRSCYEPIKALSHTYRYNSMLLKLVNNSGDTANGGFHDDGFDPLDGILAGNDTVLSTIGDENAQLSPIKLAEMQHIIDICRERNIKLLMATSPYHARHAVSSTIARTDSLCRAHGIPYRSWLNDPKYNDHTLYHTADHLNAKGAHIFSQEVAAWTKQQLGLLRSVQ